MTRLNFIISKLALLFCMLLSYNNAFSTASQLADGTVVITVEPGVKLKKAYKGVKVKNKDVVKLIIQDQPGTQSHLDFYESYDFLKKFENLESLDVSKCFSLNQFFNDYKSAARYYSPLNFNTLILGKSINPSAEFIASLCDNFDPKKLNLREFSNLKRLEYRGEIRNDIQYELPDTIRVNLDYGNSFVPYYLTKTNTLVIEQTANPERFNYQILLSGGHSRNSIRPRNTLLDGVLIAHCSFLQFLPEHVDCLTVPASLTKLLGEYNSEKRIIDKIIFEETENPIYVEKGGLSGVDEVKYFEVNRPIIAYGSFGNGIFAYDADIIFNKSANLDHCNLGFRINSILFKGKTSLTNATIAERVNKVTFHDETYLSSPTGSTPSYMFKEVDIMRFYKTPRLSSKFHVFGAKRLYVPIGSKQTDSRFADAYEFNILPLARKIEMLKPGTILSNVSLDDLASVDSLTITGFLYETDMNIISQNGHSLKYLDLSNAVITESPQRKRENQQESEAFRALFGLIGLAADASYNNYEMSSTDYIYTKTISDLISKSQSATKAIDECFIPAGFLENNASIETVVLPSTLSSIGNKAFSNCTSLSKVTFPKYLKSIGDGAFSYTNLTYVSLPSTLKYVGDNCFSKIKTLSYLDFGNSKLSKFGKLWIDATEASSFVLKLPGLDPNCETAHYVSLDRRSEPKSVIYFPESCKYINGSMNNCILHFSNSTPPQKWDDRHGYFTNCIIYCPIGSSTAYYNRYGQSQKYVEE